MSLTFKNFKYLTREQCTEMLPWDFEFHRTPFTHQLQALLYSVTKSYIALFLDMGTGKTPCAINWIRWWKIENRILIITVNFPLAHNWVDEIKMEYPSLEGAVLEGTREDRLKLLNKNLDFYVINYEGLSVIWEELYTKQWNVIVCDESRKIKNIQALRTKLCIELGKKAPYRAILSGTPTVHPMDIFAQYLFLDRGLTYGRNFYKFRNEYFIDVMKFSPFPKWVLKKDKTKKFLDLMNNNSIRLLKTECLDLPEKIHTTVPINLTQKQQSDYENLMAGCEHLNIADLSTLEIKNFFQKFSQITGGFMKLKEDEYAYYEPNPKLDIILDLIEESIDTTKITIFHRYVAEGRLIEKVLNEKGIKYASMRGEIKNTTKEYKKFLNNQRVRVMVAHPQSGGIGLNFTVSSVCIFYSLDFNIEYKLQSEDRLHRIGQKNNVTYYYLLASHTIDEEIWRAHQEGINLMDRINNYKLTIPNVLLGEGIQWRENY